MAPTMPREGSVTDERAHLADLLTFAAGGNTDAFMRFYDLTCAAAYRAARALSTKPADAEDLVCSLYLRAWRHAAAHPGSGLSPLAWLLAGVAEPDLGSRRSPSDVPPRLPARSA